MKSKAAIKEEFDKRRHAEKEAHSIVENFLEEHINEAFFLSSLKRITNQHYDDIVEERSTANMCGYCLCSNKLQEIPSQQYRISKNKLFDITERKKFCSNQCYAISCYLAGQISTTPLWLRNVERMPDITLPEIDEKANSIKGDEIKLRHIISEQELHSIPEREVKPTTETSNSVPKTASSQASSKQNNSCGKKYGNSTTVIEAMFDILTQWLTKSSLEYLGLLQKLPESKTSDVKEMPEIPHEEILLQRQLDKLLLGSCNSSETSTKPLPDYNTLKNNTDVYEERVESFYKGSLHVRERQHRKPKQDEKNTDNAHDRSDPIMPTVDSKNQTAIRQKIVIDHIKKLIDDLTPPLPNVIQECRQLVRSFSFTSKNVMLGSEIWPVMTIAVLCLLSKKNLKLKDTIESQTIVHMLETLLQPYNINFHSFYAKVMLIINTLNQ